MKYLIIIITLFNVTNLFGQKADTISNSKYVFDLPIVDLPFSTFPSKTNFATSNTWLNPSMSQSINLSSDFYIGSHYALSKLFSKKDTDKKSKRIFKSIGKQLSILTFDALSTYVPLGQVWNHEEFHRTIMTKNRVGSEDNANRFPFFNSAGLIVNGVRDEDLARFKKSNPKDFIRLDEAGIEGDYQLIHNLQKNNFFFNQNLQNEILYHVSGLYAIFYVYASSKAKVVDSIIDRDNRSQPSILERDFVGPDFTGWCYNLFHPNTPFDSLGIHPSGEGINRYIKTTQLNADELHYLHQQGNLAFLNLASPMLFGFHRIAIHKNDPSKTFYINLAVRHYLTPFGNDINVNFFYQKKNQNWVFALHNYNNYNSHFIGLEAENIFHTFQLKTKQFPVSTRLMLWIQPNQQDFKTSKAAMGGLIGIKAYTPIYKQAKGFIEVTGKTNGWVAGNEFLNSNVSLNLGFSVQFDKIKTDIQH